MKLYYSPGACSLAPHIALYESKLKFDVEKVDLNTKKTESGGDFLAINSKGYVPTIKIDDNQILTECAVILQYIAAQSTAVKLAPPADSFESYKLKEWLNFIASELHKGVGLFFRKNLPDEVKNEAWQILEKRFKYLEQNLSKHKFLMGDTFTVADAYLFTILRWTHHFKMDLSAYPALSAYFKAIQQRPAVQETLNKEGLKSI